MAPARDTGHPGIVTNTAPPGGIRKRTAFPRPRGTLPQRPVQPAPTAGQRPTRRARSARQGRGGRWPGALGPRLARGQPGAVAGAMAPARDTGHPGIVTNTTPPGGNRKRTAFPRPRGTLPPGPVPPAPTAGQRPTRRARSARRGRCGRWPGGFGPRLARDRRGAVKGAMAPARDTGHPGIVTNTAPPGGKRKRTAFPPPARNAATKTRATRTDRGQRPTRRARSARQGRGGRWPGALGPRRAKGQRGAVAGAMAPAMMRKARRRKGFLLFGPAAPSGRHFFSTLVKVSSWRRYPWGRRGPKGRDGGRSPLLASPQRVVP